MGLYADIKDTWRFIRGVDGVEITPSFQMVLRDDNGLAVTTTNTEYFKFLQQNFLFENTVIVKKKEDLLNIDSTKSYLIDGTIDMGTQSIEIPETGISIAGLNGARDTSILFSNEDNYTLFISPNGGYSGNVVMESMTLTVTGFGAKVFDLDNSENANALDISVVNFTNCTSLGDLTSYRQLLFNNVGFIFIDDGLTFNGTWSGGMAIITAIAVVFPASTLFKEGASLIISGSVRSDINFLSVNSASVLFDFQASNITADGGLVLTNVRTTADNAMPNLDGSNVKVRYKNCLGIRDTYVGGEYAITATAATTITVANTMVKMAGTTTYSDLAWFLNTGNNEFTYTSDQEVEIEVVGSLSFTDGANKSMGLQVRLWDDSASAYVDISSVFSTTFGAGGRVDNLAFIGRTVVNKNDRIEIWIENQTDTSDITCEVGGFVGVSERSS